MINSISLIGMAGAGKSSVGKELSKMLGFTFIDSDDLIEAKYGKNLQKILDDEGYIQLREIENLIIKNIHFDKTILSTGGSAVYSNEAMTHIQKNSNVIFLDVPFSKILERVPSFLERGFAKAPSQSIEDAFTERQKLYQAYSHFKVSNTKDLDSCVTKIIELF
jgi:shikimate kinase